MTSTLMPMTTAAFAVPGCAVPATGAAAGHRVAARLRTAAAVTGRFAVARATTVADAPAGTGVDGTALLGAAFIGTGPSAATTTVPTPLDANANAGTAPVRGARPRRPPV